MLDRITSSALFLVNEDEFECCQECGTPASDDPGVIGVETDDYDGILYWVCGVCYSAWPRFTGDNRLGEAALAALMDHQRRVTALADRQHAVTLLTAMTPSLSIILAALGYRWTQWGRGICGDRMHLVVDDHGSASTLSAALATSRWEALVSLEKTIETVTGVPVGFIYQRVVDMGRLRGISLEPAPVH